ncbi:MAG: long-chain fatty acid--CoA ligase [Acidimicrobiales bacterium]|nr:long-chain fatty acid--CoA ligase [Acidimicrobiales bacterium]
MPATMGDLPLTVNAILRHGRTVHGGAECVTFTGEGCRRATYAEVAANADRLAAALTRLGIGEDDRVGTFLWNNQEHLEAYFAVPCMGAILHTLNIRLSAEQLVYVVGHAQDRIVLVDDSLVPVIGAVADQLTTVEAWIVVGAGDAGPLEATGKPVHRYLELLAAEAPGFAYPEPDERAAAAMCYTSGTTGDPKGVAYSHRSTFLHSLAVCTPAVLGLAPGDAVLTIVPQFHANAWGLPYAAFLSGADLHLPDRFLQAEPLVRFIAAERPTLSAAVPTVWSDIYRYGDDHELDLSSLRAVVCGGAAVPRSLMERFAERDGLRLLQGWGMTEMSPIGAVAHPPPAVVEGSEEDFGWRARTGRVLPGVELRIVDDRGEPLPWDGEAVGEFEVRGPWVTTAYWDDPAAEKFHDGWLRTGDVGTVTPNGFMAITDRAKDVIKSGGEWISSVELENAIMAHPRVVEAAVIGIPDPRWDERPLACVVVDGDVTPGDLKASLADGFARWQLPESWAFVEAIPRTSVGKFDKRALRRAHEDGDLAIVREEGGR